MNRDRNRNSYYAGHRRKYAILREGSWPSPAWRRAPTVFAYDEQWVY